MEMQTHGPAAGWSWLMRGLNAGFEHPKTLFGGGALFLVYVVAMTGLQMLVQRVFKLEADGQLAFSGVMMLVGTVIYPLLAGGFLRMLDTLAGGGPARALDLFDAFRAGRGGGRLVALSFCLMLIYAVFLALLYFTVGQGLGSWYMQVMALGAHPAPHATLPSLPDGAGATFALLIVFLIYFSGVSAIALGQVAVRGQAPLAALRDGLSGALKNVLPLLVLAIISICGLVLSSVALVIVAAVLTLLLSLISKALGVALVVAIYLAVMLLLYVAAFGVMYAIWRDVSDVGHPPADVMGSTSVEA